MGKSTVKPNANGDLMNNNKVLAYEEDIHHRWKPTKNYLIGDLVTYVRTLIPGFVEDIEYEAIHNSKGSTPSATSTNWKMLNNIRFIDKNITISIGANKVKETLDILQYYKLVENSKFTINVTDGQNIPTLKYTGIDFSGVVITSTNNVLRFTSSASCIEFIGGKAPLIMATAHGIEYSSPVAFLKCRLGGTARISQGSRIIAKNSAATTLIALSGSFIEAQRCEFIEGLIQCVAASTGKINVTDSTFTNFHINGVSANTGGIVVASTSTSGATVTPIVKFATTFGSNDPKRNAIAATNGGQVIAKNTDARCTAMPNDLAVEEGGIIYAFGTLGGTNTTPNNLSEKGVIFRL